MSVNYNRYNLALIPVTQSETIIRLAQQLAPIAHTYLLGKGSLPHVTLCQFMAEETGLAPLWKEACSRLNQTTITLIFGKFSCINVANYSWVSLLPDQTETLNQMHNTLLPCIKNAVQKTFHFYDPHMSLLNTKDKNYKSLVQKISETYTPINDTFTLALGKSDDVGQLTEIIHQS